MAQQTNTEKAIKFWETFQAQHPDDRIAEWVEVLKTGRADWFRNYGLTDMVLANECRIGRIGFDEKKYARLKDRRNTLLEKCGLPLGSMQN